MEKVLNIIGLIANIGWICLGIYLSSSSILDYEELIPTFALLFLSITWSSYSLWHIFSKKNSNKKLIEDIDIQNALILKKNELLKKKIEEKELLKKLND